MQLLTSVSCRLIGGSRPARRLAWSTAIGLGACGCGSLGHSDAALIQRFAANRATFERLVAMSDSDPRVIRIAPTFTRLDINWGWPRADSLLGFSVSRWNAYRAAFASLGLADGLYRDSTEQGPVVILAAESHGIVNRGWSKGYAFCRCPLHPVVASLDRPADFQTTRHGYAFRRIAPQWYLEFDW